MKYITILTLILAISPLFNACSALKTVKEAPFTVKLDSPKYNAGSMEAQFEKVIDIGDLRKIGVTVDYYPLEDAVCFQYRLDYMTFYQFWEREGREEYLKALEKYKEEYTQRTLNPKSTKKTKSQYGVVEGYLIWQAARYTVRASAPVKIDLGYFIRNVSKNKVAFFTLYQREAIFIDEMKNEKRFSNNLTIYLTRAQADELAGFFDQDFLRGLSGGKIENRTLPGLDVY